MSKKLDWLPYGQLPVPVIMKAWSDPAFKKDLLSDPIKALKAIGYDFPAGTTLHIHENTGSAFNLVMPEMPQSLKPLSADEMEKEVQMTTTCAATGTCD